MGWSKKNLVSNKDMTDTYECSDCGYTANYRLGEIRVSCPECMKEKPLGWWSVVAEGSPCICGVKGKKVPKQGHILSEFWELQRGDDESLYYCPEGCLDGESLQDVVRRLRQELKRR